MGFWYYTEESLGRKSVLWYLRKHIGRIRVLELKNVKARKAIEIIQPPPLHEAERRTQKLYETYPEPYHQSQTNVFTLKKVR